MQKYLQNLKSPNVYSRKTKIVEIPFKGVCAKSLFAEIVQSSFFCYRLSKDWQITSLKNRKANTKIKDNAKFSFLKRRKNKMNKNNLQELNDVDKCVCYNKLENPVLRHSRRE